MVHRLTTSPTHATPISNYDSLFPQIKYCCQNLFLCSCQNKKCHSWRSSSLPYTPPRNLHSTSFLKAIYKVNTKASTLWEKNTPNQLIFLSKLTLATYEPSKNTSIDSISQSYMPQINEGSLYVSPQTITIASLFLAI